MNKKNKKSFPGMSNKKIYDDYYEILKKDNFVTFDELMASALLENNISLDLGIKQKFLEKMQIAYHGKLDLRFNNFVITWNKNLRFSSTKNIPTISDKESHNVESQNFFEDDSDKIFSSLLKTYNQLIAKLVFEQNRYVEITEGIIVYVSRETEHLKLAFSEKSSDLSKE